ncbi:PEP-CTERM sorting domain-containing protein [Pleionea sp. CnH1-48]|uniref:PEP-CTERM sorting domain-containing protein n=1 Tax=Pleionea sp. CnH1-48 TaxID=2954494 RepID=UPI002096C92E|nr:PEP-CTERM sorting domain-containing protein [Pleionea sp. CnH1-48]MCO7226971.1 PEP-CTERM sorting domain-containing protein [Pleionea sp. CnH1-48]
MMLNNKALMAFVLLFASSFAMATPIQYSVSGIVEDNQSSSVNFGGDGDVYGSTNDGSTFDLTFSLDSTLAPDSVDNWSWSNAYNYYFNPSSAQYDLRFLINGTEVNVASSIIQFSDRTSNPLEQLRVQLFFSPDDLYGIPSMTIDAYGMDLFSSNLSTPSAINAQNLDDGMASGWDGYYHTRTLGINTVQVPEPTTLMLFVSSLLLMARRKSLIAR